MDFLELDFRKVVWYALLWLLSVLFHNMAYAGYVSTGWPVFEWLDIVFFFIGIPILPALFIISVIYTIVINVRDND